MQEMQNTHNRDPEVLGFSRYALLFPGNGEKRFKDGKGLELAKLFRLKNGLREIQGKQGIDIKSLCKTNLNKGKYVYSKYKHLDRFEQMRRKVTNNVHALHEYASPQTDAKKKPMTILTQDAGCPHVAAATISATPHILHNRTNVSADLYDYLGYNGKHSPEIYADLPVPFEFPPKPPCFLAHARKYGNYLSKCNRITNHPNSELRKVSRKLKPYECTMIQQFGRTDEGEETGHIFLMCKGRKGEIKQLGYFPSRKHELGEARWIPMYTRNNDPDTMCFMNDGICRDFSVFSKAGSSDPMHKAPFKKYVRCTNRKRVITADANKSAVEQRQKARTEVDLLG